MTNVIRIIGAAAALSAPLCAASWAESFTTSGGLRVELRPPEQMTCDALRSKMAEIDATGYRKLGPPPVPQESSRLFDYESAVSNRYYSTCGGGNEQREAVDLRDAFRDDE